MKMRCWSSQLAITVQIFTVIALLLSVIAPQEAHGVLVNVTVDDTLGDERTGILPVYAGDTAWNAVSATNPCPLCVLQPDIGQMFDGTYHDGFTSSPVDNVKTITIKFTGTAVYVVFALFSGVGVGTNAHFVLDGQDVGTFLFNQTIQRAPFSTANFFYQRAVFTREGIPNREHTLVIGSKGDPNLNSIILFDYIMYTADIPASEIPGGVPTGTSSTTTSTSSTTSSTSSTSSSTSLIATVTRTMTTTMPTNTANGTDPDNGTLLTSHIPAGAVIGGVLGGLSALLGIGFLAYWIYSRKHNKDTFNRRVTYQDWDPGASGGYEKDRSRESAPPFTYVTGPSAPSEYTSRTATTVPPPPPPPPAMSGRNRDSGAGMAGRGAYAARGGGGDRYPTHPYGAGYGEDPYGSTTPGPGPGSVLREQYVNSTRSFDPYTQPSSTASSPFGPPQGVPGAFAYSYGGSANPSGNGTPVAPSPPPKVSLGKQRNNNEESDDDSELAYSVSGAETSVRSPSQMAGPGAAAAAASASAATLNLSLNGNGNGNTSRNRDRVLDVPTSATSPTTPTSAQPLILQLGPTRGDFSMTSRNDSAGDVNDEAEVAEEMRAMRAHIQKLETQIQYQQPLQDVWSPHAPVIEPIPFYSGSPVGAYPSEKRRPFD